MQQAIEQLRMAPVLFEMAARPHDARLLYRAYLAQSHIFIGLYWERYGWVGPGMDISGLEDEYRRAQDLPRLIYLKSPAPDREQRLKALINDIKNDNVSYKYFSSAKELRDLVENDLALLLTERFEQSRQKPVRSDISDYKPAIPHALTALIGRQKELKHVQDLLARPEVHLVTLVGPGGVGKTRLALEIVSRSTKDFDQKVYWVPLADIRTPELVLSAIASVLDVRERAGVSLLDSLKQYLREQQLLLLLDNFEQVIAAGPLIAELLAAAPGLTVLVTSRSPLRLRGEIEVPVLPLDVPDPQRDQTLERQSEKAAVQLFVERAQAIRPDFSFSEETAADVVAIVRRLDGLPLAIELAAARIRLFPPPAILERLNSCFNFLAGGAQDLPVRQRTLQNTIEWSFGLLEPEAQTLFCRLSVFVRGFTLEATTAVCDPQGEMDILEALEALLDNSLVRREATPPEQPPRFSMLQTIGDYAQERLLTRGEASAIRERHAHYFAHLASIAAWKIFSSESEEWMDLLKAEYHNLRTALDWFQDNRQEINVGWQMMIDINWFWYRRDYLNEARQRYEQAVGQAAPIGEEPLRANILLHAGIVAMWQSDFPAAARLMDSALPILQAHGEPAQLAVGLFTRGVLAVNQNDTGTARQTLEEVHDLLQQMEQEWFLSMTLLHLGNLALCLEDVSTAQAYMEEAHALGKAVNDRWIVASTINNFGEIARYMGDYEYAEGQYLISKELFAEIGSSPDIARADHSLGYIAIEKKDYPLARKLFDQSMHLHQQLGVKRGEVEALAGLAALMAAEGAGETAMAEEALRLYAAAKRQFANLGAGIWPADRVDAERAIGRAKALLSEAKVQMVEAEGRLLSLEEALARALKTSVS